MAWQVGDKRYAIHVTWPYGWRTDFVTYLGPNYEPMTDLTEAVREAEKWKVNGQHENSTTVTIFEEVLRLV